MALRGSVSRILRLAQITAGACVALSTLATFAAPADAHPWRHYHRHAHYAARHHATYAARRQAAPSDPAFAAIVVDANSGRTLYGVNENELRHPASITKVMTLYLLFEQLDKGAVTLQTQIPVSEHAAAQEPSKLGLEPGETISVENAIKAIVTRSANDVAVAIAEAIGHDESAFAEAMTRKAHALGMSRTLYRNASGLPNDEQVTTARDLTILARATEERFPRYFKYYSTHEFEYGGEVIGNHNHLLGRVDGVDGIKTGYTRASGFNLLTSVHRDGRALVAVVMGGRTSGARDAVMESLIADHIAEASNNGHTATMIADAEPAQLVAAPLPPVQLAAAAPTSARSAPAVVAADVPSPPARPSASQIEEGDSNAEDDEDSAPRVAAVLPPAKIAQRLATTPPRAPEPARPERVAEADPQELGWVKGPDAASPAKPQTALKVAPLAAKPVAAAPAARPREETEVARNEGTRAGDRGGWIIQIGATDDANKANDLLIRARAKDRAMLASATPLTEKVKKGEDVFYRARFAGLDSATAESACRSLKKSGFSCFAAHD
ncbi:MAG: serine hydrolase [Roseiarcus sp.]|jgi:D-alanyl-D-alanine carboxypeptidase